MVLPLSLNLVAFFVSYSIIAQNPKKSKSFMSQNLCFLGKLAFTVRTGDLNTASAARYAKGAATGRALVIPMRLVLHLHLPTG